MIDQRAQMTHSPATAGAAAARSIGRPRTAPITAPAAFCNSVLTADAGGVPTLYRRPPIE